MPGERFGRARLRAASVGALLWMTPGCGGGGGHAVDAGPIADAAPDAAPVACEADHAESAEAGNDPLSGGGLPEESGQSISRGGEAFTLCGQIDPAQAGDQTADVDFYLFDVTGGDPIDARVELRGASELADSGVYLDLWTASGQYIGGGPFYGDHALFAGVELPPGPYMVSVMALDAPPAPALYSVAVLDSPNACPPAEGPPDYEEADEAPTHRLNDVLSVSYTPDAEITETPAADGPEATALTLAAGESYHLHGHSADVDADGDQYLDRDTFQVATGPDTDELEIRLSWPHGGADVDMDLYLFAEGDLSRDFSGGAGTRVGAGDDEHVILNVAPDTTYWLWVATYDDQPDDLPATYDLTLCSRTFPGPP